VLPAVTWAVGRVATATEAEGSGSAAAGLGWEAAATATEAEGSGSAAAVRERVVATAAGWVAAVWAEV